MKTTPTFRLILMLAVLLLLVGAVFAVVGQGRVRAALGNTGVPVRCYRSGALAPGGAGFMTCTPASGPAFVDGQRVPNGYYLLVLDVLVTPDAGTDTASLTDVTIYSAYGENSRRSSFRLRQTTSDSYGFKFSAPYLVLQPGDRIEVVNAGFSQSAVEVKITGLLVTNVNYIPLAMGE